MTAPDMRGLGPGTPGRLPRMRRAPAGRHRHGRLVSMPDRREWDIAQKARAAQLDLLEPGWLVLYGPYYRRFYAIARMNAVTEPLVEASGPEELRSLMRLAEAAPADMSRETGLGRPRTEVRPPHTGGFAKVASIYAGRFAQAVPSQSGGRWQA
ncbi:hypothetical protein [Sphaerisporangium perillae]|uniref:hypothetical protein n=1 Tax=Sphaerisporangium perillae TaxID=2935860 RepID=UPI00201061B3|nr:hypothetical protein [Sphaerisporangium perillae]